MPKTQTSNMLTVSIFTALSLEAEEEDSVCLAMADDGAQMGDLVVDVGEEGETRQLISLHDGDQVASIEFHGYRTTTSQGV